MKEIIFKDILKLVKKYGNTRWKKISVILNSKYSFKNKKLFAMDCKKIFDYKNYKLIDKNELLELCEKYPGQWNTIGKLLNTTADACFEEYKKIVMDKNK